MISVVLTFGEKKKPQVILGEYFLLVDWSSQFVTKSQARHTHIVCIIIIIMTGTAPSPLSSVVWVDSLGQD